MNIQFLKRILICVASVVMLTTCLPVKVEAAKWDVTRGEENYTVEMDGATDVFIGNQNSIGNKVGTKYYMTYTIEEDFTVENFRQNGIVGTNRPSLGYPYEEDGFYYHNITNQMNRAGHTYFIEFVVTEKGFKYSVACAKGEESHYVDFKLEYGELKNNPGYFGVYLADDVMTGKLIKVRCYDKDGNDLGVRVSGGGLYPETNGRRVWVKPEKNIVLGDAVNHSYTITVNNAYNLAISNKKKPTSGVVYMEYTVKSSDSKLWQAGVINSTTPTAAFPYMNGEMKYNVYAYDPDLCSNEPTLVEGAHYLYKFEKFDYGWDVRVEKTLNGETTQIGFSVLHGTFNKEAEYFSLWCGDGPNFPVNAVLEDFKCYDSNLNNLGVQSNRLECEIVHHGEAEDYAGCEAVYYCKQDGSLFALYADQTLKYTENGVTLEGTYEMMDNRLITQMDGEKQKYDYLYQYFTAKDGRVYERLHTYKVTFEACGGSEVQSQILSAKDGYVVKRPEDPIREKDTFKGWYTSDGKEYQFEQFETESITLYAHWDNDVYSNNRVSNNIPYISIGASILIILGSIACGVLIVARRRKK